MATNNRKQRSEPVGYQLDFAKMALGGVLIMIMVSGFTTFSGMRQIIDWYVALFSTFVIQIMLATAAWFLGQDLARLIGRHNSDFARPSAGRMIVIGVFFLMAFAPSAFFSFTYYFNNLMSLSQ